jgi:hypothetical protein
MSDEDARDRIGPRDEDILPPGWRLAEKDGRTVVVSPKGRWYVTLPAGYPAADMQVFEDTLEAMGLA